MTRARRSPRWAGRLSLVALAVALALAPGSAAAMSGPPSDGNLSPRLAELARPSLRSAPLTRQATALSLAPDGPGSLLREGRRVLVDVRFDHGAAAGLEALRAAGTKIVNVSRRYRTVTVAAKPVDLRAIGAMRRVGGVTPVRAPILAATCPSGEVVSEGDSQLRAAQARSKFAVDGSGVEVGILSDSFDEAEFAETHAAEDVETADLPGPANTCGDTAPVDVLKDFEDPEEATDEGRAMTQIVHDLAPKADLAFATAFDGELDFAQRINELVTAGAEVLADDVFYTEEPFFQDGPVAVAVNEAAAAGVTYFSAAGNDNLIDAEGHEIASWETPEYRNAGGCPPAVQSLPEAHGTHCLDFNPGSQVDKTFGMKVAPGATLTVDLQWDEPWFGVSTDLDAFLLNAGGNLVAASAEGNIGISQKPVEVVQWVNESKSLRTVQLAINRFSGGAPRLKFALLENGFGVTGTEYPRSTDEDVVGPTVFGHSGAAGAISVGAVPFGDSSEPEEYSSRGPVTHDFGPVEGAVPAAPLGSPEVLSKPDVAATDCGVTTFFAIFVGGDWRFCGTSAAAPHAAAVAALMLDAEPAATPAEVRSALFESSAPVGAFGPCAVGAGLVEAEGAIEGLLAPVGSSGPSCAPPTSEGSGEEARAPGEWGSEGSAAPLDSSTAPPPASSPSETALAVAPRTFFRQRPDRLVRTRHRRAKVVFRFGSNESGVSFACRIDAGLFRSCPARLALRFGIGWHTVRVVARDAAGNGDRTPAFYRFRVKQVG